MVVSNVGKYTDVDKFLTSDAFKDLNSIETANVFMHLLHLMYDYELECYTSVPEIPENIAEFELSSENEPFILEIIELL